MKDQQQTGAKTRRYGDAFKREAVRLWKSRGQPAENERLRTELASCIAHMTLRQRRPLPGLLHHADCGRPYASAIYLHTWPITGASPP